MGFSIYRISANSFRGNYSFLNLTLCTVTFGYSTYRCGNYSRAETMALASCRLRQMSGNIQMFKSSWWIFTIIHSRFLNPQDFVSWMHTKNSYRCRMPSITLVTIGWLHKNWWLRKTFGKNLAADVVKTNTFADKFPRLFHRLVSIHIWEEAQAKPEGGKNKQR